MVDILDIVAFVRDVYFANKETSQLKNILLQFAFEVQHVKNVMGMLTVYTHFLYWLFFLKFYF